MPPAPIGATISYEPRRVPGVRIMGLLIWLGYVSLPQPSVGIASSMRQLGATLRCASGGCRGGLHKGMERLMKYSRIWLWLGLLFAPAAVRAQPANSSDSTELVKALLDRVEQLEKRVAELEGRSGPPAPAAQPAVAAAEPATTAPATAASPNPVAEAPQV